ncbi:MAG: helix-turn-helix domain-containing protein [Thermomicrobiales bacterium]
MLEDDVRVAPRHDGDRRASHARGVDGAPVELTATEFQLLATMARRPGQVFTRGQLLDAVRGDAFEGYERAIDAHIKNIRRKVEPDSAKPTYVQTVYGVAGYRFAEGYRGEFDTQEPPPWWPADEPWPPDDWKMAATIRAAYCRAHARTPASWFWRRAFSPCCIYWDVWRKRRPGRQRQQAIVPFSGLVVLILLACARHAQLSRAPQCAGARRSGSRRGPHRRRGVRHRAPSAGGPKRKIYTVGDAPLAARLRNAEVQRVALQAEIAQTTHTAFP